MGEVRSAAIASHRENLGIVRSGTEQIRGEIYAAMASAQTATKLASTALSSSEDASNRINHLLTSGWLIQIAQVQAKQDLRLEALSRLTEKDD